MDPSRRDTSSEDRPTTSREDQPLESAHQGVTYKRPPTAVMLVLLIAALALVAVWVRQGLTARESQRVAVKTLEGVPEFMIKGDPSATTVLIEWSDYECPFCARHATTVGKQIDAEYVDTGKLRVAFRDLPLTQMHQHAMKAAEAARCAGELSGSAAFWGMHDTLFANQDEWSAQVDPTALFSGYAAGLGVDAAAMDACLADGRHKAAIEADMVAAGENGVGGTPAFLIQEAVIYGAQPFETFKASLDIAVAGGTLPTATVEPTEVMVEIEAPRVDVEVGEAPVLGSADAKVTIIEFSDYQCPYCKMFADETYATLIADYVDTGRVRYAFRDLPLDTIHPAAVIAARAAHCARDGGGEEAYFKMHDALFAEQKQWSEAIGSGEVVTGTATPDPVPVFSQIATGAGLDGAAIAACLSAGTHADTVSESFRQAFEELGIAGTPTFVINGQVVSGTMSPEMLETYVAKAEKGEPLTFEIPQSYIDQATAAAAAVTPTP